MAQVRPGSEASIRTRSGATIVGKANASEEGKIGDEMQVEQRQKLAKEVVVSSRVQKRRAPHSCELATPDLG